MAPEILGDSNMPYTEKADIYSFGLVLWEIVTGKTPYEVTKSTDFNSLLQTNKSRIFYITLKIAFFDSVVKITRSKRKGSNIWYIE